MLKLHIFRAHFEALVLVFPDHRGIELEQPGRKLVAGLGEQPFGFLRGVLVRVVVVAGRFALAVVPMGDGVDRGVARGPFLQVALQAGGDFVERDKRFIAMLANQAGPRARPA